MNNLSRDYNKHTPLPIMLNPDLRIIVPRKLWKVLFYDDGVGRKRKLEQRYLLEPQNLY